MSSSLKKPRLRATAGVKKATSKLDTEILTLSAAFAAPPTKHVTERKSAADITARFRVFVIVL
jgi:hypothetical protein